MAIGLGRMFGFRFLENFNYPYSAGSVQEFWRRLYISLSSWFRDYLYIPLGGNRAGLIRTYCNLMIVFVLCGFWHGASWNFLIWDLLHGLFLVIERAGFASVLNRLPHALGHIYTLLVVMFAWVFFRAETLTQSLDFLSALSGLADGNPGMYYVARYLNVKLALVLCFGVVLSTPVAKMIQARTHARLSEIQGQSAWLASTGFAVVNNDHFGWRSTLITLNSRIHVAMGVSPEERVIVGRDGWLFVAGHQLTDQNRGAMPLSDRQLDNVTASFKARKHDVEA